MYNCVTKIIDNDYLLSGNDSIKVKYFLMFVVETYLCPQRAKQCMKGWCEGQDRIVNTLNTLNMFTVVRQARTIKPSRALQCPVPYGPTLLRTPEAQDGKDRRNLRLGESHQRGGQTSSSW